MRNFVVLLVIVMLILSAVVLPSMAATITTVGEKTLSSGGFTDVKELSGITYAGPVAGFTEKFRYYVVSDNASGEGATPRVYGVDIVLNMSTGAISSATVVSRHNLAQGYDLEGIVYNPSTGSVFISDENSTSSRIMEFDLANGTLLSELTVPSVYAYAVDNYGFESLTSHSTGELWTTNEEAVTVDGQLAQQSTGSTIRLMKYDSSYSPDGQWAYVTDPIGVAKDSLTRSGVSDMTVLPNGTVLTLERRFTKLAFYSKIYEVNFTGATDVSGFAGLIGQTYTTVTKTNRWAKTFVLSTKSYEGMCLGPQLSTGQYSLILISDISSGANLYGLRVAQ